MARTCRFYVSVASALVSIFPLKAEDAKGKGAEVARVAIIKYEDKTGTKNFGYMPGSLQEAITKSMHTKFEFVEINPETVEPSAAELKAKNKGAIDPKTAAEICRKTNTDILIYGNFTFNTEEKEIEIQTYISLGSTDKHRTLRPVENRVDATIFQAADRVAADIVAEITKVAIEQQQAKGEAEKKDQKGKTALARTEKSTTWADTNWMIHIMAGANKPLLSSSNATQKVKETSSVEIFRRISGNIHLGVAGSYFGIQSDQTFTGASVTAKLDGVDAAALFGYFFDLSPRWRLTTSLGAGYFLGSYYSNLNCSGGCSSSNGSTGYNGESFKVRNPVFMVRSGVHVLLFSFLTLGFTGEWRMHYDSPKSIHSIGGLLSVGVAF